MFGQTGVLFGTDIMCALVYMCNVRGGYRKKLERGVQNCMRGVEKRLPTVLRCQAETYFSQDNPPSIESCRHMHHK